MKNIVIKNGYYRNNRYVVLFPDKYIPKGALSENKKTIFMNCNAATIPGVNFQTVERREASQTFKVPYDHTVNNLTFRFYCSESFLERKYFEHWFDDIYDPVYRCYKYFSGSQKNGINDGYGQDFDIVLLSDLAASMISSTESIVAGERSPLEILHVKIFGAFPTNLSDVNISYDTVDTIGTFDVQVCFLHHALSNKTNFVDSTAGFKELYFASMKDFFEVYGDTLGGLSLDELSNDIDDIFENFKNILSLNISNSYTDLWSGFGSINDLSDNALSLISSVSNVFNNLKGFESSISNSINNVSNNLKSISSLGSFF